MPPHAGYSEDRDVGRLMWKSVTWAFGNYECRLDWMDWNGAQMGSCHTDQDDSLARVVPAAGVKLARKSRSVSTTRVDSGAVRSFFTPAEQRVQRQMEKWKFVPGSQKQVVSIA